MTKATDLKSPWKMGVKTCVTLWYLFKTKKNVEHFFTFFWHFFQPSLDPNWKVIDLIFFQWAGLEKLGFKHAFQPYTYSLRPFSPQSIHKFRPPSLYRVKSFYHMFVKRFIKDYMLFTSSETYFLQRANLNCFQECAKFGSKKVL